MISPQYRQTRERLVAHPKRWLITGVAGFIGSNLLEDLLSLGQDVVGLDNFSTGYRANIDEVHAAAPPSAGRFSFMEGDIRDLDSCRRACAGVDYVIHQAALASVPRSIEEPLVAHAVNVNGFINLLVAARDACVKRFVYASSSAVYGDAPAQPQVEDIVGRPRSPYAANKAINETAFQMTYGMETIGLRYYNIFGRRQDPNGAYAAVIPRWISNLLNGERCLVFGDGETTRDFCYVTNVIQANILAATLGDRSVTGNVYNIASSESVSLNQLFRLIREQLPVCARGVAVTEPVYKPFRPGDIRHSSGSIEKARAKLGFSPSHAVGDGLRDALPWYLEQCVVSTANVAAYVE